MDTINNLKKKLLPSVARDQFDALGTQVDIQIVVFNKEQSEQASADIRDAKKLYVFFTSVFSRFDKESELSKLNGNLGSFNVASEHMLAVAKKSLEYYRETENFFDPRILNVLENSGYADDFKKGDRKISGNAQKKEYSLDEDLSADLKSENNKVLFGVGMDFSGIAKGYITDEIAKFLVGRGWKNFLVDSGGDMFMQGVDENGKTWTVDIEGAENRGLVFSLNKMGIATSGISRRRWEIEGRRMHHLVNPKKPTDFSFEIKAVTVISDCAMDADVWAKTLFLMGRENGILYANENEIAAVILDYRGNAWVSSKAKQYAI